MDEWLPCLSVGLRSKEEMVDLCLFPQGGGAKKTTMAGFKWCEVVKAL